MTFESFKEACFKAALEKGCEAAEVFFREDEIPQFILDKTLKEDGYIPSCVKEHLKKSK